MIQEISVGDVGGGLMSGIVGYGVWVLKGLALNVASLNEKMANVLVRMEAKEHTLTDHEARLRALEQHGGA